MMQVWADYLDGLKAGAVVLPFKTALNTHGTITSRHDAASGKENWKRELILI